MRSTLIILAWLCFSSTVAVALTQSTTIICQKLKAQYKSSGHWCRKCGPVPGGEYQVELKRDCLETISRLNQNPGQTWAQHSGWASKDQCYKYLNQLKR